MKMFVVTFTAMLFANSAVAQNIQDVDNKPHPDCKPGSCVYGIHHKPGLLPGYPTAAVIWPRVIRVECSIVDNSNILCDYPARTPSVHRGEYIMYEPVFKKEPVPQVIIKHMPGETIIKEIIKEVPPKKIKE